MVFGDMNRIRTNNSGMHARLSQYKLNIRLENTMARLSTGKRLNKAEDGAAGLSISNKLSARLTGLNSALNNIEHSKEILSIADTSYQQTVDQLIEMKSLVTRAVSDTVGEDEKEYLLMQVEKLGDEINSIANQAVYQGTELLNGKDDAFIHPKKLTAMTGERSEDLLSMELPPVNLTKLFEGSNHLIGTGSRSYFYSEFYAGLWNRREPDQLMTQTEGITSTAELTTDIGETAKKMEITVNGTTTSHNIGDFTETPSNLDLHNISAAVNNAGIARLTAEVDSGEIKWTNKSDQDITVEILNNTDSPVGIDPITISAAEVIEKVRVTVGGTPQEAALSTPQVGDPDITVFADAIESLNIDGLSSYVIDEYNPDELGVHSTSFEDIEIEFLNSDGNVADVTTFNMLSPKANQVTVTGPDGSTTSPITEYTGYPDPDWYPPVDEYMHEYEQIINDMEVEGFWATYDEEFQRLIINNVTEDDYTLTVGSDTPGTPGISPKVSEAPDELMPQGKLYFGRAGSDLASDESLRVFMRELDHAIGDMTAHMNTLGSIQQSLNSRRELVSSSIISNSTARSRIIDADFAKEQSKLIRLQILQQTNSASLAQANMGPKSVLGFLE
ncbi:MAG: hypothetical protein CL666_01460 [Balneola sp.]|nr:hypothetical protein [Balneola sp.]|tara:strand:- start:95896 stop:97743 length:1848 start_codon:yes stop_codon:yes gene_type:complete